MTENLNILIVSQYFWPENFRVNDIAAGFVKKGHRVTVFTGIPNYPWGHFYPGYGLFKNRRQNYRGVFIKRVPLIPRGRSGKPGIVLNYLSFVFWGCLLIPFYCRERYDAIFIAASSPVTMTFPALVLKKLRRIPILLWVLDLWPESIRDTGAVKSPLILRYIRRMVRYIYRRCDRILVPSEGFIPRIEDLGVTRDRVRYLPNWAEDMYRPTSRGTLPIELRVDITGFKIIFAGNIGEAQSFPTILSAAEKLRQHADIHWLIIGDGRMRGWVEEEVKKRQLTDIVHLLGSYPPEVMPAFFAEADLLLVSLKHSPIFSLTIPGKVQSYLACGRPIIAALDGEGGSLIAEAAAGLACPPEDPGALARAVLAMYRTPPEEREKMGRNGSKYCEAHFNRTRLFAELEEWIRDLT